MKFISKFAKFDNWDDTIDSPNAPTEQIYESRMNRENAYAPMQGDSAPLAPPPAPYDIPPAGNIDFLRDSNEENPPF